MAITYKIHATNYRENQYEIFYDLLDGKNVVLGNQIWAIGKNELDSFAIEKLMLETIIPSFGNKEEFEQEQIFTKVEIEVLLKEKGYLTKNQTLDDLVNKDIK